MHFKKVLLTLVLLIAGCVTAQADPLVLSLQNNSFTASPGQTVTILASATNSGATSVTISSVSAGLNGSGNLSLAPFSANFSGQVVASGATLGPLALLNVIVFPGTPVGESMTGS